MDWSQAERWLDRPSTKDLVIWFILGSVSCKRRERSELYRSSKPFFLQELWSKKTPWLVSKKRAAINSLTRKGGRRSVIIDTPCLYSRTMLNPARKVLPPCPCPLGALFWVRKELVATSSVLTTNLEPSEENYTELQQFHDLCDLAIKVTRHERLLRKVSSKSAVSIGT